MSEEQRDTSADLKQDFRVFLAFIWQFLGLPEPTPTQLEIAKVLQHGIDGKSDRLIIEAFRGVGKSWITCAFVCWLLFCDPNENVMIVSANKDTAEENARFIRELIESVPLLQALRPKPGQLDKISRFTVGTSQRSKDPSVKSVGITGQLTGSRASTIIADDVEVPKNSYTQTLRMRLAELVKEFDAVLKPGGRIFYLGTPQSESSIYPTLEKRGYRAVVWPSEVVKKVDIYRGNLSPRMQKFIQRGVEPGTPVEPTRFGAEELTNRRLSYGRAGYALQYLLDTTLSDADKRPLKCRDLICMDVHPKLAYTQVTWSGDTRYGINSLMCGGMDGDYWVKPAWLSDEMKDFEGTVMAVDPSGKGKDETAIAIVRQMGGMLYLVKSRGWSSGFADSTLEEIAELAVSNGVTNVVTEWNYGGGMFDALLQPVLTRVAREKDAVVPKILDKTEWNGWSSSQKERRICDTLEPLLLSHRLIIDRRVVEDDLEVQETSQNHSLIQQLTRIERESGALIHEDRLETVAIACAFWRERIDRDPGAEKDRHKARLLDAELRKFMRGIRPGINLPRTVSAVRDKRVHQRIRIR